MDFDEDEEVVIPHYARKFRMPSDPILLAEYELFKPSSATLNLRSEHNREIFAEAFIEGDLDSLENLCVKSLAKMGIRGMVPQLRDSPELMRIFYDALDVELPLRDCYMIEDQRFWRRVVLAKTLDKTLHLKRWNEFDWKSEGVSRKFVELVESCPVFVQPQEQLVELAGKVAEFVNSMHVRKLQAMPDYKFTKYLESDPEFDITSEEEDEESVSSDEPDTEEIDGEEGGEEQSSQETQAIQFWRLGSEVAENSQKAERLKRNAARQEARRQIERRRADRELRHQKLLAARYALENPEVASKKKKKKKKEPPIRDVFNINIAPEPPDDEDIKPDHRNKMLLLSRIKRYNYPDEHCHHIDLGFVRHFENMVSLTLEFLGPPDVKDYHSRYMKFSYGDMVRLGRGVRCLTNLTTFRLRNSMLNQRKLSILARSLRSMELLEEVDFGYDQMADDCSEALGILLNRMRMYRILQLEYNRLGNNTAMVLNKALSEAHDGVLEYLGLAHNSLTELALHNVLRGISGTHHVLALNISGIDTVKGSVGREIGNLLRNHTPLRSLEMASVNIGPVQGLQLVRSLEKNDRILYMDCRECDLDPDQEFEVDIIVRRNNYIYENMHHGENLCEVVKERRHPIVKQIEEDYELRKDCLRMRPPFSSSSESEVLEVVEEKPEVEEEQDIWAILGINTKATIASEREPSIYMRRSTARVSALNPTLFFYNPNLYDIEQFRQGVHLPGPGNRFFYLQQHKMP
ncbi:hypothetical protein KR009_009823 [Drosophila setifemur]|nr:hypothetical protein KR009_009823 [Drosophila setifemur]